MTEKRGRRRKNTAPEEKAPEPKPCLFDPIKETKKGREARINAIVKKALESVTLRDANEGRTATDTETNSINN